MNEEGILGIIILLLLLGIGITIVALIFRGALTLLEYASGNGFIGIALLAILFVIAFPVMLAVAGLVGLFGAVTDPDDY